METYKWEQGGAEVSTLRYSTVENVRIRRVISNFNKHFLHYWHLNQQSCSKQLKDKRNNLQLNKNEMWIKRNWKNII